MKRKITCFIVAVLFVFMLVGCNIVPQQAETSSDGSIKYTMYIGLNDKDSYRQEIATEDAKKIVTDIASIILLTVFFKKLPKLNIKTFSKSTLLALFICGNGDLP